MPIDAEKRDNERQQFLSEIVLEFASGKREARISDISLGGCYVDSIATVAEGEPISLVISILTGESMRLTGEVAYLLPGFGFGIRFTDLTEERTDFLERFMPSNR